MSFDTSAASCLPVRPCHCKMLSNLAQAHSPSHLLHHICNPLTSKQPALPHVGHNCLAPCHRCMHPCMSPHACAPCMHVNPCMLHPCMLLHARAPCTHVHPCMLHPCMLHAPTQAGAQAGCCQWGRGGAASRNFLYLRGGCCEQLPHPDRS